MKSLRSAHPISYATRAFTVVEMTVAAALLGAVGLTTLGVLRSSAVLASQNAGINLSSSYAREVIDQLNEKTRYALEQPALINTDGTAAAGATSDGIIVKKYLGNPYVVKEPGGTTGDIVDTATQFCVEYTGGLPDPMVGDWMLMDSATRPELQISAISTMTPAGSVLRKLITTTAAIGEFVRPAYYRIAGSLYRKEAYTFVATDATANPRFELRHYGQVQAGTVYTTAGNYKVMANGYRRLQSLPFFTNSTSNGATMTTLKALANSSNRQEYIARNNSVSTFTTIPVQVRLWSLNR